MKEMEPSVAASRQENQRTQPGHVTLVSLATLPETLIAHVFNLLYRRFVIGRASAKSSASELSDARRLQARDTADEKSALRRAKYSR